MAAKANGVRGWRLTVATLTAVAGIALVTGAVALLKTHVPVLSLGSLYVLVVLPIAVAWGLLPAVAVAFASMLTFEFFFLPPVYSLALARSSSWFALGVFVVTAAVVSELAARVRRRAREGELLARIATTLLESGTAADQLDSIAAQAAAVLEVRRARIVLGGGGASRPGESKQTLVVGERIVGSFFYEGGRQAAVSRSRLLPALASLLAVAIEHDHLAEEAYQAEALRRSDVVKTAIIRAVSHDLRTPLATMETALGSLRDSSFVLSPTDRDELLDAIGAEHARLKRLVENLLDISRLQAGAAQPLPALWATDQLLVDALDELGAAGRVEIVVPEQVPLVRVDAAQIERVIVNLLENALKFSPTGAAVRVRVDSTREEVVIRVINQGRGIPQAELTRIFEPFQRLPGEHGRGAGLGLAIAKGFTEANGGRVWAESKPGQGASFILALPAAAEAPAFVAA